MEGQSSTTVIHNGKTAWMIQVAFNTAQDIEFLKWLKTTQHTAHMLDVDCGESGVYYAWFTWELEEAALEEYMNGEAQPAWEQLDLEFEV